MTNKQQCNPESIRRGRNSEEREQHEPRTNTVKKVKTAKVDFDQIKIQVESLILAQDERWRRA